GLGLLAVAVAGVVALIAFFNAHDSPTTSGNASTGPGQADTTASSSVLRAGNVILEYSNRADLAPLRAIARAETGTDAADSSLVAAGPAGILGRIRDGAGATPRALPPTPPPPHGTRPA